MMLHESLKPFSLCILLWRFLWLGNASAQITETKLIASDGLAGDHFGWTVSISGDYAVVGINAPPESGSAYVFRRDGVGWIEEAILTASDGVQYDFFGISVSISGDYAVVGAFQFGSAYVFKRDGMSWIEEAKLRGHRDQFGESVSISGDYVVVGARRDQNNGAKTGAAYVFNREGTTWSEGTMLTASDGGTFDEFGNSVAILGDRLIVGSWFDDDNGLSSGSAYIFRREGIIWVEEAKLTASDGAANDLFGNSVSLSDDYAVVGAPQDDANGSWSGSIYIFRREGLTWHEEAKLTASDGVAFDFFGKSVSSSGEYVVAGATTDDGSAYVFRRDGTSWSEELKLNPSDSVNASGFGYSVSISGDDVLIGATGHSYDPGAAYVYSGITTTLCADITSMVARCIGGDTKTVQVRVNLLNNTTHEGDSVTITIDGSPFTSTIISNGTHSRANFSIPGWTVGDHVVSLVDPPGCLADIHAICAASDGIAKDDPEWNDDAEWTVAAQDAPQATELLGNYPNPFNPTTAISYQLSADGWVVLKVYNMLGQVVATLVDEAQTSGYKSVVWNGRNESGASVASGIYIYRMTAGKFTATKRMLLLR